MAFLKTINSWRNKIIQAEKEASFFYQATVISIFTISGVVLYLLILNFLLPKSLPLPKTTAINWLTVHKHSMTLDYIRFGIFVVIIPISILIGWIGFLWKKYR